MSGWGQGVSGNLRRKFELLLNYSVVGVKSVDVVQEHTGDSIDEHAPNTQVPKVTVDDTVNLTEVTKHTSNITDDKIYIADNFGRIACLQPVE